MILHKKLIGEVPMVYSSGVVAGAAVVGAGYTIYSGEKAREAAESRADEQKRAVVKQQALIDAEKAKQDKVAAERRDRLRSNELLSGSETGVETKGSLLS